MVREFVAIIKAEPDSGGAYIKIPFDIKSEYGCGRLKVDATFDGVPYIGNIVNMGVKNVDGSICWILGITKAIRARICKDFEDSVRVTIIPARY